MKCIYDLGVYKTDTALYEGIRVVMTSVKEGVYGVGWEVFGDVSPQFVWPYGVEYGHRQLFQICLLAISF